MVRPIVVAARYRGQGLGRHLLERVMPTDRRTTLVARGHAAGFYSRVGFSTTSWEFIPACQRDECGLCPERDACAPQPMVRPPQRPPVQRGAGSAGHGRANTAMQPREERS